SAAAKSPTVRTYANPSTPLLENSRAQLLPDLLIHHFMPFPCGTAGNAQRLIRATGVFRTVSNVATLWLRAAAGHAYPPRDQHQRSRSGMQKRPGAKGAIILAAVSTASATSPKQLNFHRVKE